MKKILHYGNLTGLPFWYARACESAGMNAENVISVKKDFMSLKRELPFDDYLCEESDSTLSFKKKRLSFFLQAIRTGIRVNSIDGCIRVFSAFT